MPRTTGFPRVDAQDDFNRARRRHVWAWLKSRGSEVTGPVPFDAVVAALGPTRQRDRGIATIPLDSIVGSVDRTRDFDQAFRPASSRARMRWEAVAEAMRRGQPLPPISVYRVGDAHFVRDGHHRVSVARALGHKDIDAHVVEIEPLMR
ncbi:MAG TPA: hypothetical protein VFA94_12745 [Acidimicrobiales bacterium]|nr:hypothetical protein [Acidimicrobiales bacterium]